MTNQEGVIREVGGHHRNRRNGKLEKQWNTIGPSGLEATFLGRITSNESRPHSCFISSETTERWKAKKGQRPAARAKTAMAAGTSTVVKRSQC